MPPPHALCILDDLQARRLIFQSTDLTELQKKLHAGAISVYAGFDPTADSLHVGHLLPLLTLRRFQLAGHRPIALVGGATGSIGDPSFKSQERQRMDPDQLTEWTHALQSQLESFLDLDCRLTGAQVLNNNTWSSQLNLLGFLRDIGRHFSVNAMIQKEAVKQRLAKVGSGLSFTEFSYSLLQAYDFVHLYQQYGTSLQIGGADQWGNLSAGITLVRRLLQREVHGLTWPLMTKADGQKFGKTEQGTLWLSPAKTSPYAFYQFWLTIPDSQIYQALRAFTFLPLAEIDAIEAADRQSAQPPQAQMQLAREVTRLVHGAEAVANAERISSLLFQGHIQALTEADFLQLALDGIPAVALESTDDVLHAMVKAQLSPSRGQARGLLDNHAIQINGQVRSPDHIAWSLDDRRFGRYAILKRGKKSYALLAWPP